MSITEEFSFLMGDEDTTTFEEDSQAYIEEAIRYKSRVSENINRTVQGIKFVSLCQCISIEKTEIMPWEHTVFTLDVNVLKNIDNRKLSDFRVPPFIEEIRSIENKGDQGFGYNQAWRNGLKYIYIPKSVAVIAHNTFAFYRKLNKIEFEKESKLIFIGNYAFGYCESLHSLDFRNCKNLDSIGHNVFEGSSIKTLKISENTSAKELKESNIRSIYRNGFKVDIEGE